MWQRFNGFHIEDVLSQIHIDKSNVYSVVRSELFTSKIRKALDLLKSNDSMKGLEASALVYDFLISFLKYAHLNY